MKKIVKIILIITCCLITEKIYAYESYIVGDKLKVDGDYYFVLRNSDSNTNYITLLKETPLTVDELYSYGKDNNGHLFVNEHITNNYDPEQVVLNLTDNIGGMAYYTSDTCKKNISWSGTGTSYNSKDIIEVGCDNKYNTSDVKKVIENWGKKFSNDLISIDNYKVRLLNEDDLINSLHFELTTSASGTQYISKSEETPWWVYTYSYWIMNLSIDDGISANVIGKQGMNANVLDYYGVRPVINISKTSDKITEFIHKDDLDKEIEREKEIEKENNKVTHKKGQQVIYKNTLFYVLEDSYKKSDYVYLIKALPLTAQQVREYSDNEYQSQYGEVPYYTSEKCNQDNETECYNNYKKSIVKKIVDNYVKAELDENDLFIVDGLNAKIPTMDELLDNYSFIPGITTSKLNYMVTEDTPSYILTNGENLLYWLMNNRSDAGNETGKISSKYLSLGKVHNPALIKPTIYLKKSVLEKNPALVCKNGYQTIKKTVYKNYFIGDEIDYMGEKYYVIENSLGNKNYVTLLKDKLLTNTEINKYNSDQKQSYKKVIGQTPYYFDSTCNSYTGISTCDKDYNHSAIKKVVDRWASDNFDDGDLVEVNNYKARLLSDAEITPGRETEEFNNTDYFYYTMNSCIAGSKHKSSSFDETYMKYAVRPVIFLKKSYLGERNTYSVGEKVTDKNGEEYYVQMASDENSNYVTLLKAKPLNQYQVNLIQEESYGVSSYYASDKCYDDLHEYNFFEAQNTENNIGCTNIFEKSYIKDILDNWSIDKLNIDDLVIVEGYKVRLIRYDELLYFLGYDPKNLVTSYSPSLRITESVPEWVYNKGAYWTMSGYQDYRNIQFYVEGNGTIDITNKVYDLKGVRPVINLNKCVLEGGCTEEEIIECITDTSKIVDVEKTFKEIPKVMLMICGFLIVSGSILLLINYIQKKQEEKNK